MKKKILIKFIITGTLFLLFILLTVAVLTVDVQSIGPEDSSIGLAALNKAVFDYFKVNMVWFHITEALFWISVVIASGFAVYGFAQLIKRKSIKKVDFRIVLLGISYLITIGCYVLFEIVIINYRPIILGESLAASFPSSTTLTVVSIMGTAILQFNYLFKHKKTLRIISIIICGMILGITVIGRLVSDVHWFTDILGGLLLSSFIIMLYRSFVCLIAFKKLNKEQQ